MGGSWFGGRSERAIADFFQICEATFEAAEASARELERVRPGAIEAMPDRVAGAREHLRLAAGGDWGPFEAHLDALGRRFAHEGLAFEKWYGVVNRFYAAIAPRMVQALAGDRLSEALVVLGDYMQRSLALIESAYQVARAASERELDDRNAQVVDGALDAIITIDGRGVVTEFNPSAEAMFGYTHREAVGRALPELIIPHRFRSAHSEGVERASTGQVRLGRRLGGRRIELTALRANGQEFPMELSVVASRVQGKMFFTAFMRDLTEKKQAEASILTGRIELERSASRLRIISTTSHEFASAEGNPEMLLAFIARRFAEILGDGCVARALSEDGQWIEPNGSFYHPDPEVRGALRQLLGTTRQRVGEGLAGRTILGNKPERVARIEGPIGDLAPKEFRDALGAIEMTSALAVPLQARGRTVGVVSIFRTESETPYSDDDVQLALALADRAALALDNATLVATLERRVHERTSELEAVNRELEAFNYTVSHDLRAPLRAIAGFSRELVEDHARGLDEQAQYCLTRIRAATTRMGQLIDDLLELARVGRSPLRVSDVNLSELAMEIVDELRGRDPLRTVEIAIEPALVARGDVRLVRIVLENLLGNAWKFTARASRQKIELVREQGAFCVKDSGAGFDMALSDRLFMPFQRLHAANDFEGTGLGLATVERIIRLHGGTVSARGALGEGATICFTLAPSRP